MKLADIMLAYGTTEGHTRLIVERMAELIGAVGHRVYTIDTAVPTPLPERIDAVIVGASVHQGHHQASVTSFVLEHGEFFEHLPSAFFSVSLAAALPDELGEQETQTYIDGFVAETGWHPRWTLAVAGALRRRPDDGYLRKLLLRLLAQQLGHGVVKAGDVTYTDWADVDAFVLHFLHDAFEAGPPAPLSEKPRRDG